MGTTWRSLTLAALMIAGLLVGGTAADAQTLTDRDLADPAPDPPAYAVRLEGEAQLVREGQPDELIPGLPLEEGDHLTTGLGRLEWRRDGAEAVFLDRHAAAVLNGQHLTRLDFGTLVVTLPVEDRAVAYRVDTPAASVRLSWPGRYRLNVRPGADGATTITTWRGRAVIRTAEGDLAVGAGEQAVVLPGGTTESLAEVNVAVLDNFDRWVEASPVTERNQVDAEQLPRPLAGYGPVLSRHGVWRSDVTYGKVWYPNVVPDWRPYASGRWHRGRRFGPVWIGADPWSWPTHHYGRWEMTGGSRWFWIPAAGWSAAHVYWAVAPGYVAWAPLGWSGRPLVDFRVGLDYYSSGGFRAGDAFVSRGGYDPWRVWTVVPTTAFGHRRPVADSRLHRTYFRPERRVPFVMTPRLPPTPGRMTDSPQHRGRAVPSGRSSAGGWYRPQSPFSASDRTRRPRSAEAESQAFGVPRGDDDPYVRAERTRRQRWPDGSSLAPAPASERRAPGAPLAASPFRPRGSAGPRQPRDAAGAEEYEPSRMRPAARPPAPRSGLAGETSPDMPRPTSTPPRSPFGSRVAPAGDAPARDGSARAGDRTAPQPPARAGQAVPRGEGSPRNRN